MLKPLLFCLLFVSVNTQRNSKRTRNFQNREVANSLYTVYDPLTMSVTWPTIRNGIHVTLSDGCFEDLSGFFKELRKGRAWATMVADASGLVIDSGAYSGRRQWFGSRRQCSELDKKVSSKDDDKETPEHFRKIYNLLQYGINQGEDGDTSSQRTSEEELQKALAVISSPPYRLGYNTARLSLTFPIKVSTAKRHEIVQGLCLPSSCTPYDVSDILNFSIMISGTVKSYKIPRSVKIMSIRRLEQYYKISSDVTALSLISITLFLLLLSIIATLLDYKVIKCRRHATTKKFNVQKYNNDLKLERKSNLINMETLSINNIDNANVNHMTVKKVIKPNAVSPSITVAVVSPKDEAGSCKRCGKYKKQCANPKAIDIVNTCPRVKYNSFAGLTEEKRNLYQYLLLCFSLNYSWKRIFNTNMANKDLSIMHGLRIATTFWVVFIHVAYLVSYLSDGGTDLNSRNNIYIIHATGSLAFDTLFFVSGLFSSYHFFYLKSQYSLEELVSFGGVCGQVLQLCCFITNRAVRLLPSYAYVIFLTAVLARVSHRTSVLDLPERDYNCDTVWWRNILYITNVYPAEDRCMQISWYFTSETQLHAIGALVCAFAARRRLALSLAALAVCGATAADVTSAFREFGKPVTGVVPLYRLIMEGPWARVAPYFIGVFGGWLVRRMGGKLTVSRIWLLTLMSTCLWLASLAALMIASAIPWVGLAWAGSLLHLVWPAVLLWPALVCATNYAGLCRRLLDSGAVAALSRLSYSVLLLHGVVTRTFLLSLDGGLCSSTMCIFTYFAGTTLLTLLASLLLSLLVEIPCCSLLRRLSDCATLKSCPVYLPWDVATENRCFAAPSKLVMQALNEPLKYEFGFPNKKGVDEC